MVQMLNSFLSSTIAIAIAFAASLACAVLIVRWGWRQARQYSRSRDAIRRIASPGSRQ
jgi:hypothetical protein